MLCKNFSLLLLASTAIAKFSTSTLPSTPSHVSKIHNSSSTFSVALPTSRPILKNITTTLACPVGQILGQYWPNWETSLQSPSKINLNQTDLVFYFVLPTTQDGFSIPAGQDLSTLQNFVQVSHQNGQKAIVSIGGWDGSVYFSDLVSTPAKAKKFASMLSDFISQHSFDGIDMDWEYPGLQGAGSNIVSPSDAANFLDFLHILRNEVGASKILHAAVSSSGFIGSDGSSLKDVSSYGAVLDYITIMAYDYYGASYSSTTGPNGPLDSCDPQSGSAKSAIQLWTSTGFPACRILLGIGTYYHIFRTSSRKLISKTFQNSKTLIFQPLAPKSKQPTDSATSFNQLIAKGRLKKDGVTGSRGFKRYWDFCTSTPFLFNARSRLFLSYDDTESTKLKAEYANTLGLAGINLFDSTGASKETYEAARKALDAGVAE